MQSNKSCNYDDFYVLLGKKIKNKRKALKLSQASVCGNFITRNMLSRIECGAAHPSVDTLIYISERLKTPLEYFVSRNEASTMLYKRIELIKDIRKSYSLKQYKKCLGLCRMFDGEDEEINLVISECEFAIAEECMSSYRLTTAEKYLEACDASSKKSIYAQNKYKLSIRFYRQLIESIKVGKTPDFSIFKDNSPLWINKEFYLFVFCLASSHNRSIFETAQYIFNEPAYKLYIEASILIEYKNYEKAKELLQSIMNSSPDFFTAYFTVQNLEICYKETDDFKKAYEYANMRLDLLEKFNN